MDKERIERAVREILLAVGEDPEREGLLETPARVARMYEEVFLGLERNVKEEIKLFEEGDCEEMILVADIPFYSMCEHHLLPFMGKAHVVYIPSKGKVFGLSKLARIVDTLARKPQIQERLTAQIANTIEEAADPQGICVVLEAEHLCMTMRGIKKPGAKTLSSAVRGLMKKDPRSRSEAMDLIKMGRSARLGEGQ